MEVTQPTARPELGRWLIVVAIIAAGIVLFFMFAPGIPPAVTPSPLERIP